MHVLTPADTVVVRGMTLRRDPAREGCFSVVRLNTELHDYQGMSDIARRQRLHQHMHNEMQTLEIAAQSLADFPDAPWELRMQLARQCWDESRHCQAAYRRLSEVGGSKGEFPVINNEWRIVCVLDSLPARLALQNRTFEGGEMDILRKLEKNWRAFGDHETAEMLDALLADEVQHVRFGNQWLKRMGKEHPAVLLKVAAAVRFLRDVTKAMSPSPGEKNAVGVDLTTFVHAEIFANVADRRLAEFTSEEIDEILRQEKRVGPDASSPEAVESPRLRP
jgi:hypothetical protein